MLSVTSFGSGHGGAVLGVIAVLLCAGGSSLLASRWARTVKARAGGAPRGRVTPGAWVVIGVVVAFFIVTVVVNLTGVW